MAQEIFDIIVETSGSILISLSAIVDSFAIVAESMQGLLIVVGIGVVGFIVRKIFWSR